jgi:hypothetical protein
LQDKQIKALARALIEAEALEPSDIPAQPTKHSPASLRTLLPG